jgi:hypothetical protein
VIDVESETLIDFPTAAKHPAYRNPRNGRAAHVASLYRHVMRGARAVNGERIRLEVVKTPAGLRTSAEAICRFIAKLTNPDRPAPPTKSRKRQIQQAVDELVGERFVVGGGEG